MEIITLKNLNAYLLEIADALNWNVEYHAKIHKGEECLSLESQ